MMLAEKGKPMVEWMLARPIGHWTNLPITLLIFDGPTTGD
jgi:hypothetical protein